MEGTTTTGISTPSSGSATSTGTTTPTPATSVKITVGTSAEYASKLEEMTGRAFVSEALTITFATERFNKSSITTADIAAGQATRIKTKLALGAEIVEASNWAAAACWEPPIVAAAAPPYPPSFLTTRPISYAFVTKIADAKARYLPPGQPCWHLSMMARDPMRKDKGAVRAVLEPYIARAREEGVPIWLEAASARARDVYAFFGWRVLEEFRVGVGLVGADGYKVKEGEGEAVGVPVWFMILE